jgi:hypothetical protein
MQTINMGSTKTTTYETATNLCAYEQSYTETDAEASAEVVLGPEVVRHILDNRPVRFPLLFVRHGLFSK